MAADVRPGTEGNQTAIVCETTPKPGLFGSGGMDQFKVPRLDGARPRTITLSPGGASLVVIHADGRIERGPAFTTDDAVSLLFWDIVQRVFATNGGRG